MIRTLYRTLRVWWDAKAVSRGPGAVAKRLVRRKAYRTLSKALRRL